MTYYRVVTTDSLAIFVAADDLSMPGGALVFHARGKLVKAFAPNAWVSITEGEGTPEREVQ